MPYIIKDKYGLYKIVSRRTYQRIKEKHLLLVEEQNDRNSQNEAETNVEHNESASEVSVDNTDNDASTFGGNMNDLLNDVNNVEDVVHDDEEADIYTNESIIDVSTNSSDDDASTFSRNIKNLPINDAEDAVHIVEEAEIHTNESIIEDLVDSNDDAAGTFAGNINDFLNNVDDDQDVEESDIYTNESIIEVSIDSSDDNASTSSRNMNELLNDLNDAEDEDHNVEAADTHTENINVFQNYNEDVIRSATNLAWDELAQWAINCRVTRNEGNQLLKILKNPKVDLASLSALPNNLRTLKQVPKFKLIFQPNIRKMCVGTYAYFGIEKNLCCRAYFYDRSEPTIKLNFNTDGLKLTGSSTSKFWPILGQVGKAKVFMVALYHGNSDPDDFNLFFEDFVRETKYLKKKYGDKFKVNFFTADTPAKAAALNIKYPTGYSSCPKCTVPGVKSMYIDKMSGKRIYSSIHFSDIKRHKSREHTEFENPIVSSQRTVSFHHGSTILYEIPGVDLVKDIIVDAMHAAYLNTIKKMLEAYLRYSMFGSSSRRHAILGADQIKNLSRDLEMLVCMCPVEFARRPRILKYLSQWKSSEYRQFLEYSGIVLLKKYLPENHFECFKTFAVVMRILNKEEIYENESLVKYAKSLMDHFLKMLIALYGPEFITHSVHILQHLPEDCGRFGTAIHLSCFVFENFNFELSSCISSGNNPLQQMINRYNENIYWGKYDKPKEEGSIPYKSKLKIGEYIFRSDRIADSYFSTTRSKQLYQIVHFIQNQDGSTTIVARCFKKSEPFFLTPCDSREVGIYEVHNQDLETGITSFWEPADITAKFYGIPKDDNKIILVQLLHAF